MKKKYLRKITNWEKYNLELLKGKNHWIDYFKLFKFSYYFYNQILFLYLKKQKGISFFLFCFLARTTLPRAFVFSFINKWINSNQINYICFLSFHQVKTLLSTFVMVNWRFALLFFVFKRSTNRKFLILFFLLLSMNCVCLSWSALLQMAV